jgi:hypothetical protein
MQLSAKLDANGKQRIPEMRGGKIVFGLVRLRIPRILFWLDIFRFHW